MRIFKYRRRKKYDYDLPETQTFPTAGLPDIVTEYITVRSGQMSLRKHYAWDGPTGWPFETEWLMEPSAVHDALYQLMREGHIDRTKWRRYADRMLRQMCIDRGGHKILAAAVYGIVRALGKKHTQPRKHPGGKIITIVTPGDKDGKR